MFKDKLKELRENAGFSQQALADKLFVSRSAVAKWENGNGIPSDVNLLSLCELFNVEEDVLLDKGELKSKVRSYQKIILILSLSFDVLSILISTFLLLRTIFPVADHYFGYGAVIALYKEIIIVEELGWISILPISLYLVTIVISVLDILIQTNKLNKKIPNIKIILMLLIFLCCLMYPITWYFSSWNSPIR